MKDFFEENCEIMLFAAFLLLLIIFINSGTEDENKRYEQEEQLRAEIFNQSQVRKLAPWEFEKLSEKDRQYLLYQETHKK